VGNGKLGTFRRPQASFLPTRIALRHFSPFADLQSRLQQLDGELRHLALDHPWIGTQPAWWKDLLRVEHVSDACWYRVRNPLGGTIVAEDQGPVAMRRRASWHEWHSAPDSNRRSPGVPPPGCDSGESCPAPISKPCSTIRCLGSRSRPEVWIARPQSRWLDWPGRTKYSCHKLVAITSKVLSQADGQEHAVLGVSVAASSGHTPSPCIVTFCSMVGSVTTKS